MRPNEVSCDPCDTWTQFPERLRTVQYRRCALGARGVIYRGQGSARWPLWSLWERNFYKIQNAGGFPYVLQRQVKSTDYVAALQRHLTAFKQFLREHRVPVPLSLDEPDVRWWSLGRHYQLWTPLLDWTRDPRVAAFFAFTQPQAHTVTVWALTVPQDSSSDLSIIAPSQKGILRQGAQKGLYSHLANEVFADVENYLKNVGLAHCLTRIDFPCAERDLALASLLGDGISAETLMPDMAIGDHPISVAARRANALLMSTYSRSPGAPRQLIAF
jgi:hypothetical protein